MTARFQLCFPSWNGHENGEKKGKATALMNAMNGFMVFWSFEKMDAIHNVLQFTQVHELHVSDKVNGITFDSKKERYFPRTMNFNYFFFLSLVRTSGHTQGTHLIQLYSCVVWHLYATFRFVYWKWEREHIKCITHSRKRGGRQMGLH